MKNTILSISSLVLALILTSQADAQQMMICNGRTCRLVNVPQTRSVSRTYNVVQKSAPVQKSTPVQKSVPVINFIPVVKSEPIVKPAPVPVPVPVIEQESIFIKSHVVSIESTASATQLMLK